VGLGLVEISRSSCTNSTTAGIGTNFVLLMRYNNAVLFIILKVYLSVVCDMCMPCTPASACIFSLVFTVLGKRLMM